MNKEENASIPQNYSHNSLQLNTIDKPSIEKAKSTRFLIIHDKNLKIKNIQKISSVNKTITKFSNNDSMKGNKIRKFIFTKNEELPALNNLNTQPKQKFYFYKIYTFGNDPSTIKKCFEHRIIGNPNQKKKKEIKHHLYGLQFQHKLIIINSHMN